MPTTEPMTTGEIARTLVTITGQLTTIQSSLGDKPGKTDFKEFKEDQAKVHAEISVNIRDVDKRQTEKNAEQDNALKHVEDQLDKFFYWILSAVGGAATSLAVVILGSVR